MHSLEAATLNNQSTFLSCHARGAIHLFSAVFTLPIASARYLTIPTRPSVVPLQNLDMVSDISSRSPPSHYTPTTLHSLSNKTLLYLSDSSR